MIGKVFQIESDLCFQQPCKRIHPANDIHYFTDNDIYGMPLADVGLFVRQDFLFFIFFQSGQIDENPLPEREWIGRF